MTLAFSTQNVALLHVAFDVFQTTFRDSFYEFVFIDAIISSSERCKTVIHHLSVNYGKAIVTFIQRQVSATRRVTSRAGHSDVLRHVLRGVD